MPFFRDIVRKEGALALYQGLGAGFTRQAPPSEAGPPNHHDDKEDSDQEVVNKELFPGWQIVYCTARLGFYDVMRDGIKSPFSVALIRTGARRNPVPCGTHQGI